MELWVRTQDKDKLLKIEYVQYAEGHDPIDEYDEFTKHEIWANKEEVELGQYKTKERCLEIIDEIQKLLLSANVENSFFKIENCEFESYEDLEYIVKKARDRKMIAVGDGAKVDFIPPTLLVYEMPKE